jgi:hypothetical protein
MTTMRPRCFIVCDRLTIRDGLILDLLGLGNVVVAVSVPVRIPSRFIYWTVDGLIEGEYHFSVRVVDPNNDEVPGVMHADWTMRSRGRTDERAFVAGLTGMILPLFGEYSVQIMCEGKIVDLHPLHVATLEEAHERDKRGDH